MPKQYWPIPFPSPSAHKQTVHYGIYYGAQGELLCILVPILFIDFFQCINLYLYTGNDIKLVGAKSSI